MKTVNIPYTRKEFYDFFVERIKKEDGFFAADDKEILYGYILDANFVETVFGDFIKGKVTEKPKKERSASPKRKLATKWERITKEKGGNCAELLSVLSAEKNQNLSSYLQVAMGRK